MENLKESLGFEIRPSGIRTKHKTYIVYMTGQPVLFLKECSESAEKESKATNYFQQNSRLIKTIPCLPFAHNDSKYLAYPYTEIYDVGDFMVVAPALGEFHRTSQRMTIGLEKYVVDEDFRNKNRDRVISRIKRHKDVVDRFVNPNKVAIYLDQNLKRSDGEGCKIMVHGDIQRGNVKLDSSGELLFIDLENAFYDFDSWDLSRPLSEIHVNKMEEFVKDYLFERMPSDPYSLRRQIYADAVCRMVTDGISWAQHPELGDEVDKHLKIYKEHIGAIIDGN